MSIILDKTLERMNEVFSSNAFSEQSKKLGLTQFEINNGVIANYLHKHCIQLEKRRMWRKKTNKSYITDEKPIEKQITEAIKLLKNNGYRVLKSEWLEI